MLDRAAVTLLWKSISGGDRGAEGIEVQQRLEAERLNEAIGRIESRIGGGAHADDRTADERLLEKMLKANHG